MINVNCSNLRNLTSEIENIIFELEDCQLNMFQNLKNSCISWHDGNSIRFDEYMLAEKKESTTFIALLINRKNLLKKIYDCYSQIGKKIQCDLNSYAKSVSAINSCIGQCSTIASSINLIDYNVSDISAAMIKIKNSLLEIGSKISEHYKKVTEYERQILSAINSIDNFIVNKYSYELLVSDYDGPCTLDFVTIDTDIKQITACLLDEEKYIDNGFAKFFESLEEYNSDNTSKLSKTIVDMKNDGDELVEKRPKYISTLLDVKERYMNSTDSVIDRMDKVV